MTVRRPPIAAPIAALYFPLVTRSGRKSANLQGASIFMRVGFVLLFVVSFAPGVALAQRAEAVFDQNCASCHEVGAPAGIAAKAPDRKALRKLTPEAVYESITTGLM